MKLKLFVALACAFVVVATHVHAEVDEAPRHQNALRKLGRGFANVLFGIVEIPNQYTKSVSQHGGAAGVTYGIPKGFVRWIGREFVGVYEIVTFPFPVPAGYQPVMEPEFPNEDFEP